MVNSALLAQTQTPRTSYYAQSVDGELTGHFHDDELCQLLRHEADTTQPDVIRKAEGKQFPWYRYFDLSPPEIGELLGMPNAGRLVHRLVHEFPKLV